MCIIYLISHNGFSRCLTVKPVQRTVSERSLVMLIPAATRNVYLVFWSLPASRSCAARSGAEVPGVGRRIGPDNSK